METQKEALRQFLLAKIAAGSPQGAKLAARLADTDGPVEVPAEDMPQELLELFKSESSLRATAIDLPKTDK
jgi:hypothetical protein